MRANWLVITAAMVCLSVGGLQAADKSDKSKGADKENPQVLADRIFGNADKNKDSSLDEKEVLQAKHILKSAILQKAKPEELPGGAKTFERIQGAATGGKLDGKSGGVTKAAWLDHVKDAFGQKQEILRDAQEKIVQAQNAAQEAAKKQYDRFQKQRQQQQQQQQQQRKDNAIPGKKK